MTRTVNYRKICQNFYGYTNEQMREMDVHHRDGNRNNNNPENLLLVSPEEHAKLHEHEFILWAREGSRLGTAAFKKRLMEKGPTEKELQYREKRIAICKAGLHRTPHTEESKRIISEKKKLHLANKENHPRWGNTTYKVVSPTGEEYIVSGGWGEWCLERGLNGSNLRNVALGKRKQHKGWTAVLYE